MFNEEQHKEKLKKVDSVVRTFLLNRKTIKEISQETGITTSSVQRYLNDEKYIRELYKDNADYIIDEIENGLRNNRMEAPFVGGQAFARKNNATKDIAGHFTGSKKKMVKSAYIHIPFCNTICSYCDFCKFLKNKEWVDKYLIELNKEISSTYKGEVLDTLYIGGGTPSSLDIYELNKLFDILKAFKLNKTYEFTFECNIESITPEKLKLLKENGVNRISIGIETFNDKYLEFLNRHHTKDSALKTIELVKKYFDNINIDLMYAIPGETLKELESDIDILLSLDIPHISTYSLIIEENTKLYVDRTEYIDDELDSDMYDLIRNKLKGYNHYEVSNFARVGYESKHNLTYWNNEEYYGFGCGSSGYIDDVRYDNTRSLTKYLKGEYLYTSNKLSREETIQNEFILGLRKINGINKNTFKSKYNIDIKSIDVVNKLLSENKLIEDENNVFINPKYIYTSNYILEEFI